MKHSTKTLATLAVLGAALATPIAFAQDATQGTDTAAATSAATPSESAAPATPATSAADDAAQPSAAPRQVTWADLDADKDGSLSKAEVATVQSLSQVFDDADADANGQLTADEYKAYVAGNGKADPAAQG